MIAKKRVTRTSYSPQEAAEISGLSIGDIQDLMLHGKLKTSVYLPQVFVTKISENSYQGKTILEKTDSVFKGYAGLKAEDVRKVLKSKKSAIRLFLGDEPDTELILKNASSDIWIKEEDLVILMDDFEILVADIQPKREVKIKSMRRLDSLLQKASDAKSAQVTKILTFKHTGDYRSVIANGEEYHFGDVQAAIIKLLHEAAKTPSPWVHSKTLLSKSGSTSSRMRDIFKSKDVWKQIIASNKRGYYRLNV
ncbi:MAG: hypothetical protein AAGB32_03735 [Pseudomonadota bacterium]